eukprot:c20268_g1_i2 orf=511-1884(+)
MPDHHQHHLSSVSNQHQHNLSSGAGQQHHLSSVGKTFGNIIISIVGAGVLGLPYTFKRTGWLLSTVAIVAIGIACYYCMMLLVWSRKRLERDADHHVDTFSDLSFLLYGKWGRFAVDFMIVLSQGAFCVAYLIFIGENLASVFSNGDSAALSTINKPFLADIVNDKGTSDGEFLHGAKRLLVAEVSSVGSFFSSKEGYIWVIFPLEVALASIRSLTKLAPFSIFADFANGISMAIVMQEDVAIFFKKGIAVVSASQGLSTLTFVVGVAIYAFEGVCLVLPLESSMREKKKFGRVLGLAMACITLLYVMFGLLGYLAFGDDTLDIITLNLGSSWKTTVVKVGLCVGLFFTFSVMMYPVHQVMEHRLVKGRPSVLLRTMIVLAATLCAVAVPHFGDFLSLVGNSVCCALTFIVPALIHMKAFREDIPKSILGLDYAIIAFGALYSVWGTISAVQDMLAG